MGCPHAVTHPHNMECPHSCHSFHATQNLYNCHSFCTTQTLHTTVIHLTQHGYLHSCHASDTIQDALTTVVNPHNTESTQLSFTPHKTGFPDNRHLALQSHTTQGSCGLCRGHTMSAPPSEACQQKQLNWEEKEQREKRFVQCIMSKICNHLGNFPEKDCFSPTNFSVSLWLPSSRESHFEKRDTQVG